jgi:hypothetical protein
VIRSIAARAFLHVSIVVGLAVAALVFAIFQGEQRVALGIACGAGIALVCGLSWLVGALLTFEAPMSRFLRATLGLGPVRMLIAVAGVSSIAVFARARVDVVALGCAFAGAHLLLQLAEADCFMRLADASSRYPKARPIRFRGLRFF